MIKFFDAHSSGNTKDYGLLLLRIVVCFLLLNHGGPKLMRLLSGEPIHFANIFGMGQGLSFGIAFFAEFVCVILVLVGFGARWASIPIILEMLVLVFHVHFHDEFGHKELPALYMIAFAIIFFIGPGKFSLDYLLGNRKNLQAVD